MEDMSLVGSSIANRASLGRPGQVTNFSGQSVSLKLSN